MENAIAISRPVPQRRPKHLDVYALDSGWNEEMSEVLKAHLHLIATYLTDRDNFYLLNKEQSTAILKENREYIGKDPMLIVYDSDAKIEKRKTGCGFRCCLGVMKSADEATALLQNILRIVLDAKKSQNLKGAIRKEVHREGLDGMMQIVGEYMQG